MKVGFVTNVTASVNLDVLRILACSSKMELGHVYFFDTLADSRSSLFQVVQQFGWRRLVSKLLVLGASRCRLAAAKFFGFSSPDPKSCYEYAKVQNLPHSIAKDFHAAEIIEHIKEQDFDVLVVCVCKCIFKTPLLSIPKTQFVNIHPSLLPNYRGPTPTFWALYNGEVETGVSIHRLTKKIDSGEILFQQTMPLEQQKQEAEIEGELFRIAASAVEDVLIQHCGSGRREPVVSNSEAGQASGSYHSYPTNSQRAELARRLPGR